MFFCACVCVCSRCMFMCMHMSRHGAVYMHMYVYAWRGQRSTSGAFHNHSLPLFLRCGLSSNLAPTSWAGQMSPSTRLQMFRLHLEFTRWRSSCLQNRHCTSQAVSSTLKFEIYLAQSYSDNFFTIYLGQFCLTFLFLL